MSDTLSVELVGPSYWTYMATVLADCLERASQARRVEPDLVPQGVYRDAKAFFRLVLQSVGDKVPDDPSASLNAYVIATDAIRRSSQRFPTTREALGDQLKEYSKLINRLNRPGRLRAAEVDTAKALHGFFARLAQAGESEVYETTFDLEPPFVALSFVSHR